LLLSVFSGESSYHLYFTFNINVENLVGTEDEAGNRIAEIAYTKFKEQGHMS